MCNEAERLSLDEYLKAFFPSSFNVDLTRSADCADHRLLIVRDGGSGKAASYEGPLLAILDICSMGTIAAEMCNHIRDQILSELHRPAGVNRSA